MYIYVYKLFSLKSTNNTHRLILHNDINANFTLQIGCFVMTYEQIFVTHANFD